MSNGAASSGITAEQIMNTDLETLDLTTVEISNAGYNLILQHFY